MRLALSFVVLALLLAPAASAQESDEQAMKQANNPIANFKAVTLQNYYVPKIGQSEETSNTFWARYAQPVDVLGSWLVRASLPLQRVPTPTETNSGLGDLNVFAAYLIDTGNPEVSVGVGPLVVAPTASGGVPSPDMWQLGLAGVFFNATSNFIQYGGLVTWQTDVAGSNNIDTSVLAIQPFGMLQMGKGLYLRSVGIWVFDLENDEYYVPIGFGVGKSFKRGKTVFNAYLEPQTTVLAHGTGEPEMQILAGFNLQFMN